MELYVIRHGQTDFNLKNIFLGHMDIPLNEVGIQQAKEIAIKMKNVKADVILVSPLQRTIQTANYIQDVIKAPIKIDNRLIERSFGKMEGCPNREDFNIKMMLDYKANYTNENIEPIQSLFKRINNFLDNIIKLYKDKQIILVTHGGVSQAIECFFNGIPNPADFEHLEPLTLKNGEVRKYVC